eukprot:g3562.t1
MVRLVALLLCAAPAVFAEVPASASLRGETNEGQGLTARIANSLRQLSGSYGGGSDNTTEPPAEVPPAEEEGPSEEEMEKAYSLVGCYADSRRDRVLGHKMLSPEMTTEMCAVHCYERRATYMATQYGYECWCSRNPELDFIRHTMDGKADDGLCDMLCLGAENEVCGGFDAFNLYKIDEPMEPDSEEYVGCFADDQEDRLMTHEIKDREDMTQAVCRAHCEAFGSPFYATQYGNECWCGLSDDVRDYQRHGPGVCLAGCRGDPAVACGGFDAFTLYEYMDIVEETAAPCTSTSSGDDETGSEPTPSPVMTAPTPEGEEGPMCSNGIPGIESSKGACCVAECGQCGGIGCSTRASDRGLGSAECCEGTILIANVPCGEAPCVIGDGTVAEPTPAPTEMPVEMPVAMPTEMPVEMPVARPTETPVEMPVATPTDMPVEMPVATPTDMPVEMPVATPTEMPASTPSPSEEAPVDDPWVPKVGDRWQYNLDNPVDTHVDADVFFLDLDTSFINFDRLKAKGRRIACYISVGTLEDWRDDVDAFPAEVVGDAVGDWEGEYYIDINNPVVKEIMEARVMKGVELGCDAIEPDNMDTYYSEDCGFKISMEDQIAYNTWFAEMVHGHGMKVGMKNAVELMDTTSALYDFAVNEECFTYDECGAYEEPFLAKGKPVFNVEYSKDYSLCPLANELGMDTILKNYDLRSPVCSCADPNRDYLCERVVDEDAPTSPSPETPAPVPEPTAEPTPEPTAEPTREPEPEPEPTAEPTAEPTREPEPEPTAEPTAEPTREPEPEPTAEPTAEPTREPEPEPEPAPAPAPGGDDPGDGMYKDLLDRHNKVRCMHGTNPVVWSDAVASFAREYAAEMTSSGKCGQMVHSNSEYGENLFMCWGGRDCASAKGVMTGWYDEETQSKPYEGHATAVLWSSTTEIGCAAASCDKDGTPYTFVTCNYNPPGNWVGETDTYVLPPSETAERCGYDGKRGV